MVSDPEARFDTQPAIPGSHGATDLPPSAQGDAPASPQGDAPDTPQGDAPATPGE